MSEKFLSHEIPKISVERARELLGTESVFGPEEVQAVFGFELQAVPSIPYSEQLLAEAKKNGEQLVLRISQALPQIDEPERPIDVGLFGEDGIHFHWRRSMKFGRPGETKHGAVPGIPIGYFQH